MGLDDAGKTIPGTLGTAVQAAGTRCHHDVLQEHAVVHQAATTHVAADGEHQANRRVEKFVIALVLRMHLVLVTAPDAEHPVQPPSIVATAFDIRADPFGRVIVVFVAVLCRDLRIGVNRIVCRTGLGDQGVFCAAAQNIHLPGLGVGARRSLARHIENASQQFTRYSLRRESAAGEAGGDGLVYDVRRVHGRIFAHEFPARGTDATESLPHRFAHRLRCLGADRCSARLTRRPGGPGWSLQGIARRKRRRR